MNENQTIKIVNTRTNETKTLSLRGWGHLPFDRDQNGVKLETKADGWRPVENNVTVKNQAQTSFQALNSTEMQKILDKKRAEEEAVRKIAEKNEAKPEKPAEEIKSQPEVEEEIIVDPVQPAQTVVDNKAEMIANPVKKPAGRKTKTRK